VETYPLGPSLAKVFFTTSIAPVYIPGCAVCSLVLVRSNGCPAQDTWMSVTTTPPGRARDRGIANKPTRTAPTPPAPPEMNDLMDSLVDEDPLVPAGLLSIKLGSSLYTESHKIHQHLQNNAQMGRLTIVEGGTRSTKVTRCRLEGTFPQTEGHVIMSRRVRKGLPVGRNIPKLLYQRSPRFQLRREEKDGLQKQ